MRLACVFIVASGCGFSVAPASGIDAALDDDAPATDAPHDIAQVAFCDPLDVTLVGCWELEGTGADGSGEGNDATVTGVNFVPGKVGMAAQLDASSDLHVGPRASLGPPHLSVEAWVKPGALPDAGRFGIIDNDSAYGVFYTATTVACAFNLTLTAPVTLASKTWTHVACTHDGSLITLYLDGAPIASMAAVGNATAGNAQGLVLGGNSPAGDRMVGLLDQVRVFSEARTAAQICAAAGKPTCS